MRKLFNEFFYIPKHGKVREKVMLTRLTMTITIVIMCLAAMGITAYAYFSYNVTSSLNTIKAANFEANVSITITDSNSDPVTVMKDGKVQTANLEAGKYKIILTEGNSTADTGFCVITIGDKNYYTDQIGVDVEKNSDDATVKFYLWLSAPTKIEILSHWGTSVYYGYKDAGNTAIFIVNGEKLDLTTATTSGDAGNSEDTTSQSDETTITPSTNTTTGTESSGTTPPATESTTPETTETSEPTSTTEPTEATASTETQPAEEAIGAPTTEANS